MRVPITPERALRDRSRITDAGCWEWLLYRNQDGYGIWVFRGKRGFAHRMAYEYLAGPIPVGAEIDHLCRNRACVNPAHMEPVVHAINVLRGESPQARNARKTYCDRGHELTPENTYARPRGGRDCRICRGERMQEWRAANPERSRELAREGTRRWREANPDFKLRETELRRARKGQVDRKLFCRNGHPRTPENQYTYPSGLVVCLPCAQARGLLLSA